MMNGSEMMGGMGGMGSMGMGPMGWTMSLFWILLIALVIWGLYRLITTRGNSEDSRESPLEVLRHRYASGDLSTEEYEERKRVLSQ